MRVPLEGERSSRLSLQGNRNFSPTTAWNWILPVSRCGFFLCLPVSRPPDPQPANALPLALWAPEQINQSGLTELGDNKRMLS